MKSSSSKKPKRRRPEERSPLDLLQETLGKWADKTFPKSTRTSKITHLGRELRELRKAKTILSEAEEAADMQLLLLHFAHSRGFSLWGAANAKFRIVQGRKWQKPDRYGVVEHVKT